MRSRFGQLHHWIGVPVGLSLAAAVASLIAFGTFLPARLQEASLNGWLGCAVIACCHLSALATPALLLMLKRQTWWTYGFTGLAFLLLLFDSAVYAATGATAGYFDYLNFIQQSGLASNALSHYGPAALEAALRTAALLALLLLVARLSRSYRTGSSSAAVTAWGRPSGLAALCCLVCGAGFSASLYWRGNNATRGLVPIYGLPLSLALNKLDDSMRSAPASAMRQSQPSERSHHILVIVDESVNYEVLKDLWENTPEHKITGDPLAMLSYSNSSAASNVLLRHACDPRWPDRALKGPGLFGQAKAAGYQIIFYDNQTVLQRRDNYFNIQERSLIDIHREGDAEARQPDRDCLPQLLQDLSADRPPSFILMNKRGSHFAYAQNLLPGQIEPDEHPYFASVRINTVEFLRALRKSGVLAHTSIYYTSDHGEDWAAKVPHGTTDPAVSPRTQWEVPAFVWRPQSLLLPESEFDWLSHFHFAESLSNELGFDDPEVPGLTEAAEKRFVLNGHHQAFFVFPFTCLGRQPERKLWSRSWEGWKGGPGIAQQEPLVDGDSL